MSIFVNVHAGVTGSVAESHAHIFICSEEKRLKNKRNPTQIWISSFLSENFIKLEGVKNDLRRIASSMELLLVILDGEVVGSIQGQLEKLCHLGFIYNESCSETYTHMIYSVMVMRIVITFTDDHKNYD